MSIREGSEECSLSPLEWFSVPATQTAVADAYDVEFLPTSSLRQDGIVEFYIPASAEDYIDVKNSRLYVRAKIVHDDGADVDAQESVAPVNNLLQSMWSNVEILANERLVEHTNNIHGYVSMISHLLHDSDELLESERQMQMLFKDTASQLDCTNPALPNPEALIPGVSYRWVTTATLDPNTDAATRNTRPQVLTVQVENQLVPAAEATGNDGLYKRYVHTRGSRPFEMLGNVRLNLFEQLRYLPNGISLKLRLHPQKSTFSLMAAAPDDDGEAQQQYKLKLLNATFLARRIKVSPGVLLGHADALAKRPAEFPLVRKECKSFAIAQGLAQFKQDNIVIGQLPKLVALGMVEESAFSGNYQKNPFKFNHFDASLVQVYADGIPVRSRPFRPDVNNGVVIDCYNSMYRELGKVDGDRGCIVKLDDWPRDFSLFVFSLAPDADCDDHTSLIKHGNLRVEIQFRSALEQAIQLLVYTEFDNLLKIDNDRQILVDYV
jgi:hypothetical protein